VTSALTDRFGNPGKGIQLMSMPEDSVDLDPAQIFAKERETQSPWPLANWVASFVALEFLTVGATAYVTALLYHRFVLSNSIDGRTYWLSAVCVGMLIFFVTVGLRQYAQMQTISLHRFLWSGIGSVGLAFSFLLSILFLLKVTDDYSRATFFFQLIAVTFTLLCVRAVGHSMIRAGIASDKIRARRAIVIGQPVDQRAFVTRLAEAGVETVRLLSLPELSHSEGSVKDIKPNEVRQTIDICRSLNPDDVIVLCTTAEMPRIASLGAIFSELPVSLHLISVDATDLFGSLRRGELGSLATVEVLRPPLSIADRAIKRAFDIFASSVGIMLMSPLFLGVAIAIKLDTSGPVLFRQIRHGYNNQTIRVLKFRTMTTLEDGFAFTQVRAGDPRVTTIGRVLRRTNVDELPQLLNVLLGEMSLVGPRPHPIALNKKFEERISPFSRRHNVKPGITGWAQVNGYRGETDTLEKMQRRFEHDLYYIDNWSLAFDLKIILLTLFSKTAYLNAK
jgi:Undecaprenyl-phosphate glucose phosphotransferase